MKYDKHIFFLGATKVLIATGLYYEYGRITEIIDLEDETFECTVGQFPFKSTSGATGGLVGNTPLICKFYKSCHLLKEGGWWTLSSSSLNNGTVESPFSK